MNIIVPEMGVYIAREGAPTPSYGTASSACFDLSAWWNEGDTITYWETYNTYKGGSKRTYDFSCGDYEEITLIQGRRYLIPTGLIFDIPAGWSLRLHPRSGMALKQGLTLINCEGVVDEDYVEETFLACVVSCPTTIKRGDRIAQGELTRYVQARFTTISERPSQKTDRNGGFGSTGTAIAYQP